MAINRNDIENFFENSREIRNLALINENLNTQEEKTEYLSLNPRYIGVYLSNYYSENINEQFHRDLLK